MSEETTSGSAEQVAGVGMFIAAFVDERAAEGALERMKEARKSGEFYYDEAAVIRSDDKGKIHISESGDMSTGKGAGIGAIIGGVIGLLGGPAGVVVGAGAGAAVGGLAAAHDAGFDQASLDEIGGALLPGSSALVATTSQAAVEEARKRSEQHERLTRARDIASAINTHLEMRQDVLLAMVVTEDGVAAAKVVSSPTELAVFGIVATEEGVVVLGAVLTPDVAHNEEWGQVLEWGAVGVDAETGTVIGGRGVVDYDEEWGQVLKW